jgi:ABC-type antimicrobial peptide transport system permease subunit
VVKNKFISLIIQKGKSTSFFLEKFQDSLNQMACVGLFVNDQDAVMQFLETWLAPYKKNFIFIRNMLMLTLQRRKRVIVFIVVWHDITSMIVSIKIKLKKETEP